MQATLLYPPEKLGQRELLTLYGNGPANYQQSTGDPILTPPGLYLDLIFGHTLTVSKNYITRPYPSAVGVRPTWSLKWYVVATNAEVVNGTNLSAEQIQFGAIGGEF